MKMRSSVLVVALASVLLLPGCFRTRADIEREKAEKDMQNSMQQSALESSQAMERMQAEIGRLQGRLEEVEHERQKEIGSINSGREGTEKQVADLRKALEEQQKAQAAAQAALFDEIKRLKEENIELNKQPRGSSSQKKSVSEKKATYSSAIADFNQKDYDAAADGFRAYLEAHPKGKNALDARYFLADSLYRKKDYTQAIVEFGTIHEQSPTSAFGRKSTLRIAESFSALGKPKDAKAFAQILVSSAPDSAEAKKARKFLK
jgi:TolA-binding protein